MQRKKILLGFMLAFFQGLNAFGYIENRGLYPIGEKESLLSNTGVALSGSTGAVYFNPAGLAGIEKSKISMSGNAYLSQSTKYEPFWNLDGEEFGFEAKGFQTIPSSFISTFKLEDWTAAFFVLVPEMGQLRDLSNFSTTNYSIDMVQILNNDLMIIGLAGAKRFEGGVDYGFELGFLRQSYFENTQTVGKPTVASGLTNTVVENSYISMTANSLFLSVGMQMERDENFRWGMRGVSPTIQLSGEGEFYSYTADAAGDEYVNDIEKASVKSVVPAEFAWGMSYKVRPETLVNFDLSYQFPVVFNLFEGGEEKIETVGTSRWNVGIKQAWTDVFKISGGLAYNPSAIREILADGDFKQDFFSLTGGVEIEERQSMTGVGIFYAQSRGERIIDSAAGKRSNISTSLVGVILTTSYTF